MSPLPYLSKTFACSSKVTLPNIRKGLVKVTFPSPSQHRIGSLFKSLRSLKVYFRAVYTAGYGPQVAFFGHRLLRAIGVIFASQISSSNIKFLVYMTTACEVGWNLLIDIILINHPIIVRSRW